MSPEIHGAVVTRRVGQSTAIYLGLIAVFAASMLAAWLIPLAEWVKGMIALPGIGALAGALLQISRDAADFERKKQLQLDQQIFTLGANSHMSTTAFDRHVNFCEAYMTEVHQTLGTLFREGPSVKAMECAQKLFEVRRNYAAWIPKPIALKLDPFESALNKIGAQTHLIKALSGHNSQAEVRSKAIEESYALFMNVLSLGKLRETDPEHKKELAVENVKEELRLILGINELFEIRNFIIKRSAEFARRNSDE
jgi:hypothetical protein